MKNVLRVYARDVLRLLKAPAAVVVVLVLIALPSLYTWFNVIGFWNPYDNTGNLRVCVVNEDRGATSEATGQLDLGDQILDELSSNTQLGWVVTDRETAMDEVQSGKAYAAFIIPKDFSYDFTTLLTSDFQQPQLEYYVNEKAGAVSPKITDTGATTLDESINSTFVSVASSILADTIETKLDTSRTEINASQATVMNELQKAKTSIADARTSISGLTDATGAALGKTEDAQTQLRQAKGTIALLGTQLSQISALTTKTQDKLGVFSSSLISSLDQGSILASQAASQADTTVGKASGVVRTSVGSVNAALESGKAVAVENAAIIAEMQAILPSLPEGDAKTALSQRIDSMQAENASLQKSLDTLEQTSTDTATAAAAIANASAAVDGSVQGALESSNTYRSTIATVTLPAVNSGLSQIAGTTGSLSSSVSNQSLLVDQAALALDQLSSTLRTTSSALDQTDDLLASLQDSLDTVQTDLRALQASSSLSQMLGGLNIDAGTIAGFMLSPTQIRTETLYALNAYGSAMAPLFTNLTLWIGVFMLMVILKLEVDDDGIENLTVGQRYWARWLFFVPIVALQAIVCCTGNLIIGVQTVSVPLYYLTAIMAALTYLSIQYALSVTLQHIGKGLCVVLVFAQIPGATGLYPVEMTPPFFQAVYPALPFTYGINAMRETIGGFYDGTWSTLMGTLIVFSVVSFLVGLIARPYLTNVNRMFSKEIRESDIFNGEDAQVPERRWRLGQMIKALSDRDEYRIQMHDSAERFIRWYPRLKAGAWTFGIAVPTIATVIFSFTSAEKVVVLTTWLIWLIVVIIFLVVVEHIRDTIEREVLLEDLSDDELRSLFSSRGSLIGVPLSRMEAALKGRRL